MTAREEGYAAHRAGEQWGDNPYALRPSQKGRRYEWFHGWLDAFAEEHKNDPVEPEPPYFS